MNDQYELLLVLAVLYLMECCLWIPLDSIALGRGGLGRWKVIHPSPLWARRNRGLIFMNPLPPLGTTFIAHPWPLSLTSTSMYSYVSLQLNPGPRPERLSSLIDFADVADLQTQSREILADGQVLAQFSTDAQAMRFAALLENLARVPAAKRQSRITAALQGALDVEGARAKIDRFYQATILLRFFCHALFLFAFILLPLIVAMHEFGRFGLPLLESAVLCWFSLLICYYFAHRELKPGAVGARRKSLAKLCVMPTAAIRACDFLGLDLLSEYDPLAIAAAIAKPKLLKDLASDVLHDLYFPRLPVCPSTSPQAAEIEQTFREQLIQQLEEMLNRQDISPDELMTVAPPSDPAHASYCPRCQAQYLISEGTCQDCGDRPLVRFEPETSASAS